MNNITIATWLTDYANYLETREGSLYRIRAYRRAAQSVLELEEQVSHIVMEHGKKGLLAIPGIGSSLADTIEKLVRTGEFPVPNSEESENDPIDSFSRIPGIGRRLARRIHEQLGIHTLDQLDRAVKDGTLSRLKVSGKKQQTIRETLLVQLREHQGLVGVQGEPCVRELLDVDNDYRRINETTNTPSRERGGLDNVHEPCIHLFRTCKDNWRFRVHYANTALAHRQGQTLDWVVIYFTDGLVSGERMVVTEYRGKLRGLRVVRGRERECAEIYHLLTRNEKFGTEKA